jgi:hypothetical protein
MELYLEIRGNDGLTNGSATANREGRAANERWYDMKDAGIKRQNEAGYRASKAQPTAQRDDSKLETDRVRNKLIQWRREPTVSTSSY